MSASEKFNMKTKTCAIIKRSRVVERACLWHELTFFHDVFCTAALLGGRVPDMDPDCFMMYFALNAAPFDDRTCFCFHVEFFGGDVSVNLMAPPAYACPQLADWMASLTITRASSLRNNGFWK